MTKTEFENIASRLCGRMASLDATTRGQAADEAEALLAGLQKDLLNSPHCRGEIGAIKTLVARVRSE